MKILVNALSVTNASGRHVLLGHLSRFARWTDGRHDYLVLFHARNRDICTDLGGNVEWLECPERTAHWMWRSLWERIRLASLVRETGCTASYSPAGTIVPGLPVPQVSFAQNPWALVRGLERSFSEQLKAALQRRAYRVAMRSASVMVFNSHYMHEAYRENARADAREARVIYQGIDAETFLAAQARRDVARQPLRIVSVSAMARHKGVETLVAAIARLRSDYAIAAELWLIGAWPDAAYRRRIEEQVRSLSLDGAVTFEGHVSREALCDAYASARVFALMSHCESFGIPAVEAQAFGTPIVSSNCCAIPEVCGEGGIFPSPGRDDETAAALARLLTDDAEWAALSAAARVNAERFRWDLCSRPYETLFDGIDQGSLR